MTDDILTLLLTGGAAAYFGEPVSQLEHALQAAAAAERTGASDALVVAALLHDIGHLVHGLPEDVAEHGVDARHEEIGELWLSERFNRLVTEPIRLHVAAKRYLCAVEPEYMEALSDASVASLALQGGPMSLDEVRVFEQSPFARDAVALRRWDDAAKVPGLDVPGVGHYAVRLGRLLVTR